MNVLFTLPVALVALGGCVKENSLEDCPPETGPGGADTPVTLFVDFAENLYTRALSEEVERMYVFVFGHDGYYITTLMDDDPTVGGDYYMEVPLPPGDYEFIGWSNLDDHYILSHAELVPGETTVEELFVELDIIEGDTVATTPKHLHYGLTRQPRVAEETGWEYTMEIDRYTYTINIVTEGLEAGEENYRYVIADYNARLGFYSEPLPDRTVLYVADCEKDPAGDLASSLRILRLKEDHTDSKVYIENTTTGKPIFEDNLVERLLSLRDVGETVDFSSRFEYTIKLVFEGGLLVSISVNGWVVYEYDEYEV